MVEPVSYDTGFSSLRSALAGLTHTIDAVSAGVDPLKGHPGKSIDIFKSGLPRIVEQIIRKTGTDPTPEAMRAIQSACDKGNALCESPIERNLITALVTGAWPSSPGQPASVHNAKNYSEAFPRAAIVIVPQMAVLRYRVDIGIVARRYDGAPALFGIECDGKAFHKDAAKDQERDGYLQSVGLRMMRVTGRVLNERPIGVADEIIALIDGYLK